MAKLQIAMWTLDQALALVRGIQEDSRQFGYHVCLGGGTLNAGSSQKDVDIYLLPLDNSTSPEAAAALQWLADLWGPYAYISEDYGHDQDDSSNYVYKVKFSVGNNQRIDLFIMKGRG